MAIILDVFILPEMNMEVIPTLQRFLLVMPSMALALQNGLSFDTGIDSRNKEPVSHQHAADTKMPILKTISALNHSVRVKHSFNLLR
ncbi:hypothetical protein [Shewanella sp. 125m-1]